MTLFVGTWSLEKVQTERVFHGFETLAKIVCNVATVLHFDQLTSSERVLHM
jgi:hypothetical protein